MSEATIRRLVHEGSVDTVKRDGIMYVTLETVAELRTGGRKRAPSIAMRAQLQDQGNTAADCFERFQKGEPLTAIVMALRVDPAVIEGLWYKWQHLQDIQIKGTRRCMLEHHGVECSGLPSAHASLCDAHAARARILSPEEDATLHAMRTGVEVATAICCVECGKMAERGLCTGCVASKASLTVERGLLVARIGGREIRIASRIESRAMAKLILGKKLTDEDTSLPTLLEEPEPSVPAPLSPSAEAHQALLAEVRERITP